MEFPSDIFIILSNSMTIRQLWRLQSVCKSWKISLDLFKENSRLICHENKYKQFKSIDEIKYHYCLYDKRFVSFIKKVDISLAIGRIRNVGYFPETKLYWIDTVDFFSIVSLNPKEKKSEKRCKEIESYDKTKFLILIKRNRDCIIESLLGAFYLSTIRLDPNTGKKIGEIKFPKCKPYGYFCTESTCFFLFASLNEKTETIYWIMKSQWKENEQIDLIDSQSITFSDPSYDHYRKTSFRFSEINNEIKVLVYGIKIFLLFIKENGMHKIEPRDIPSKDFTGCAIDTCGRFLFLCYQEEGMYAFDIESGKKQKMMGRYAEKAMDRHTISYNDDEIIISSMIGAFVGYSKHHFLNSDDFFKEKCAVEVKLDGIKSFNSITHSYQFTTISLVRSGLSTISTLSEKKNLFSFTPYLVFHFDNCLTCTFLNYKKYASHQNGNKKKLYDLSRFFISHFSLA